RAHRVPEPMTSNAPRIANTTNKHVHRHFTHRLTVLDSTRENKLILPRHGFRHTMSTILHEQGYNTAWIETQLAHVDKNSIRGTYNHAQYLDGRREMLQWYADYMDSLEQGGNVVHGKFGKCG
ncbi:tyrosine-type recombinase/integrase, partial [Escherichia coli]|uniref:tyrosine-type recombinase/integrase n=1 Tax=Escherichia coli TaxID=562 RepID=UPI00339CCF9F